MFGGHFFPEMPRPFNTQYRCYPAAMMPGAERSDVEGGGKIIMPPSALDQLTRLNIVYPMLFKLSNRLVDSLLNSFSKTKNARGLSFSVSLAFTTS